jgi:chloramphenicol 3-O-phosphotransferase
MIAHAAWIGCRAGRLIDSCRIQVTGSDRTRLVVLRGNSGSGKSSTARELRTRLGRGVAWVEQDYLRRIVLREHDVQHGVNIGLIDQTVRYALDDGYDVILDGILNTRHYGDMLRGLSVDHPGTTGHYYFDITLEETLRRHTTRPLAKEVSPDQLLGWYHHRDLLPFVKECIIDHTVSLEQTVERVMRELDWRCGQAVPHSLDQLA